MPRSRSGMIAAVPLCALAAPLGGCASIVEGTTQSLAVNTSPQGARCVLTRGGKVIGTVEQTPGSVKVDKSRHDIAVECNKQGFDPTVASIDSEFQAMTLGNLVAGGVIGVAVDAGTGAMNKYQSEITVPLAPLGSAPTRVAPVPNAPKPEEGEPIS